MHGWITNCNVKCFEVLKLDEALYKWRTFNILPSIFTLLLSKKVVSKRKWLGNLSRFWDNAKWHLYTFFFFKSGYTHQLLMEKTLFFQHYNKFKSSGQHSAKTSISLPLRRNMFVKAKDHFKSKSARSLNSFGLGSEFCLLQEMLPLSLSSDPCCIMRTTLYVGIITYTPLYCQSLLEKELILKEENKEKTWNWL